MTAVVQSMTAHDAHVWLAYACAIIFLLVALLYWAESKEHAE